MPQDNLQRLRSDTELYNRNDSGELLPRLGFVGDYLRSTNIIQINQNFQMVDYGPVLAALDELPARLHRRILAASYQSFLQCFRMYHEHNMQSMPEKITELFVQKAPEFSLGLDDDISAIDPAGNYSRYRREFDGLLDQLENSANAYAIVLSLGFHALTIVSPITASRDTGILDQIDQTIVKLKNKLREVLVFNGNLSRSLLLSTLVDPSDDRFGGYVQYFQEYDSAVGVKLLLSHANPSRYPPLDELRIEFTRPSSDQFSSLADRLIRIIDRFVKLREARLNYVGEGNTDLSLEVGDRASLAVSRPADNGM